MITWRVELFGQLSRFRCKLPSLVGKPENRLPSSWDSQNWVWQPTNKGLNKKKKATLCPERTADWDSSPEDAFKLPAGFWWQIIFRQDIQPERKWQIRFSRKVWLKSTKLDFGKKNWGRQIHITEKHVYGAAFNKPLYVFIHIRPLHLWRACPGFHWSRSKGRSWPLPPGLKWNDASEELLN